MTTLALGGERLEIRAPRLTGGLSLRAWLAGRWAILFSHPADFVEEHLEMDRWLSVLAQGFSARGVAAVALHRTTAAPEQGWLGRLAALSRDCAATLSLDLPQAAAPTDFAAGALRVDIAHSGPRFAMIIDADLRRRRTLRYRPPDGPPSPLELIGWAVALRKRECTRQRPGEARAHGYGVGPILAACAQPTAAGAAKARLCDFPPQVQ
jgi:hypothetical protein